MDKLYAGTNPIGVISELLLAVLNSNAHVYHVSPVLTLMEIEVTKAVGQLLGMGKVIIFSFSFFQCTLMIKIELGRLDMSWWFSIQFIGYGDSEKQTISHY